jgi:hypothetical protein
MPKASINLIHSGGIAPMAERAELIRKRSVTQRKRDSGIDGAGKRHQALEQRAQIQSDVDYGALLNSRPAMAAQRKAVDRLAGRPELGTPRPPATSCSGAPIQMVERVDQHAAETKKYYSEQIAATNTENAINAIYQSSNNKSGVFLSDSLNEWSEELHIGGSDDIIKIVLPDLPYFLKNKDKFPKEISKNGLEIEPNCKMIAEHELVHLSQESQNLKTKDAPKGARTASEFFGPKTYAKTMQNLLNLVAYLDHKNGMQVPRLAPQVEYIVSRLGYITSTIEKKDTNAEAPAVMRELRIYLETTGLAKESEGFIKFYKEIVLLDEDCKKYLRPAEKKKSSWWF